MVVELKQNNSSGSKKSWRRLDATTNSKRRNGVASKSIVESLLAAVPTSLTVKFNSFNSRDTSQTSAATATTSESASGDFPPGKTRLQQEQSIPALIQSENTASTHQKNSTEPTTTLDGTNFDVASTNTMAFSMIDWDDSHDRKGTKVEVVMINNGNHRKGKEPTKALSKKMTPKKDTTSLRNNEADTTIPVLRSSSSKETANNNNNKNNKKKTKSNSICKKSTKDINNSGKNGSSSVEDATAPTSPSKAASKRNSRALADGSQKVKSSNKATAKSVKIRSGSSPVSKPIKPLSLSSALAATPSEAPPPPLSQGPGDGHSRTSGGSSSIRSTNSPRRPRNTLTIERVLGTWTPHDNLESFQSTLGNGHQQQEQQQQRGRSQPPKRFSSVNGTNSSSSNKCYGSLYASAMMAVTEAPASPVPKLPQSKRDLSRSRHRGSANDTAAAAGCTEIQKPSSMPDIFSPVVCTRQRRSGSKRLLSLQPESVVVAANVRPSVTEAPASPVPKLPQSIRDLSRSRHRGSANDTAAVGCTEIQKPSSMPDIFSPVVCTRQRRSGSKRLLSLQPESVVVAANVRPSVTEAPASPVPKLPQSIRDLSRSRHRGSANDTAAVGCTEIQKPSSMPDIFSPVVCTRQRRSGSKRLLSLQPESVVVAANVRPSTPTRGHSLPLSSSSSHSRGRSPSKRYYESKQYTPVNPASPRRRRRHSVQSIESRDTCTTATTTPSDTGRPLSLSHRKSSSSHDALKPLFLDIDHHQGDDKIVFTTPWEESQAADAIDEKLDMTVVVPIKMKRPSSCSKLKTTNTKNKRERSSSRNSKPKSESKKKTSSSKKSSSMRSLKTSSSNSSDGKKKKKKQSDNSSPMLNGTSPLGESKIPMSTTLPVIQEKTSSSKKTSSSSSTKKQLSGKKSVVVGGKNNAISSSDTNSSPTKKKKKTDKSSVSSSIISENL